MIFHWIIKKMYQKENVGPSDWRLRIHIPLQLLLFYNSYASPPKFSDLFFKLTFFDKLNNEKNTSKVNDDVIWHTNSCDFLGIVSISLQDIFTSTKVYTDMIAKQQLIMPNFKNENSTSSTNIMTGANLLAKEKRALVSFSASPNHCITEK